MSLTWTRIASGSGLPDDGGLSGAAGPAIVTYANGQSLPLVYVSGPGGAPAVTFAMFCAVNFVKPGILTTVTLAAPGAVAQILVPALPPISPPIVVPPFPAPPLAAPGPATRDAPFGTAGQLYSNPVGSVGVGATINGMYTSLPMQSAWQPAPPSTYPPQQIAVWLALQGNGSAPAGTYAFSFG